jgi:hypothetical protein
VKAGRGQAGAAKFSDLADHRLRHFARAKDAAGCRASAELWEAMNLGDAASLYRATRLRAVTASVRYADAFSGMPLTLLQPDCPNHAAPCSYLNGCHRRPVDGCSEHERRADHSWNGLDGMRWTTSFSSG